MTDLEHKLQQLKERNLYRQRRLLQSPQGVEITLDGQRLISFCSNDYLGLAADPRVIEALQYMALARVHHTWSRATPHPTINWSKSWRNLSAPSARCFFQPATWRISVWLPP